MVNFASTAAQNVLMANWPFTSCENSARVGLSVAAPISSNQYSGLAKHPRTLAAARHKGVA